MYIGGIGGGCDAGESEVKKGGLGWTALTINAHAVRLDQLDNALRALRLRAVVLKVVVVVVQLRRALCVLGRQPERNGDVRLTNGVEEHALPVSAILVERLVDHIPACAGALPATRDVLDVVLHDGDQRLVVEAAAGDPCGELGVPDQSVAVDLSVVLLGESDDGVTTSEGEVVARRLGGLPLHGILGRHRVEVLVHDLGLRGLIANRQRGADELAVALLEGFVQACLLLRLGSTTF